MVGGGCGAWSESGSSLERRGERERVRSLGRPEEFLEEGGEEVERPILAIKHDMMLGPKHCGVLE